MSEDVLTKDLVLYDPLSETTRKERTALLGLSMLGIALVKVPLVPEKIAFLGVEFGRVQQATFARLFALVVIYYLLAFTIYAFTDYIAWRRREVINLNEYEHQRKARPESATVDMDELLGSKRELLGKEARSSNPVYKGFAGYWLAFNAARTRAAFEFLLPVAVAAYSIWCLLLLQP